mmetsp:Transcript_8511/g.20547  ORF Transcript_8511/g.20547 Transcript_8511/m.20547 type:complete len:313 (+) Transcript_8511:2723-3661(+)
MVAFCATAVPSMTRTSPALAGPSAVINRAASAIAFSAPEPASFASCAALSATPRDSANADPKFSVTAPLTSCTEGRSATPATSSLIFVFAASSRFESTSPIVFKSSCPLIPAAALTASSAPWCTVSPTRFAASCSDPPAASTTGFSSFVAVSSSVCSSSAFAVAFAATASASCCAWLASVLLRAATYFPIPSAAASAASFAPSTPAASALFASSMILAVAPLANVIILSPVSLVVFLMWSPNPPVSSSVVATAGRAAASSSFLTISAAAPRSSPTSWELPPTAVSCSRACCDASAASSPAASEPATTRGLPP